MGAVGVARVKSGSCFAETGSLNHTRVQVPRPETAEGKKGQASADLHLAPAGDLALDPGSRTQRPTLDVIQSEKLSLSQESGTTARIGE